MHTGSTVGLCPRVVNLDDGGTYHASRDQRKLLEYWLDFWSRAGKVDTVIINGDAIDLDAKGRSYQVITRNKADLLRMASDLLEPVYQLAQRVVFVRGTAAHTGKSSWAEEQLAGDCDNVQANSETVRSFYVLNGRIDKVPVYVRHVGPAPGRKPWTRLTPLLSHAFLMSLERGGLSVANHNHRWGDTGDEYRLRHIANGCWQLATDHVNGMTYLEPPGIGGIIATFEGTTYTIEKVQYEAPAERPVFLGAG
jgi:hypothetical protein